VSQEALNFTRLVFPDPAGILWFPEETMVSGGGRASPVSGVLPLFDRKG